MVFLHAITFDSREIIVISINIFLNLFSVKNQVKLTCDAKSWGEKRHRGIPKFWSRFGGMPSLKGLTVLDLGCGDGHLSIAMAEKGAKKVVGIDIADSIIFKKNYLRQHFPKLIGKVEFACLDLGDYDQENSFDLIVSRDTFEHILDLKGVLREISNRLNPSGRLYAGFGPLWNSPYGGHRRMKMRIPWGHLLLPERVIIKRVNSFRKEKISSIQDLGLNKLALRDYRKLFEESDLKVIFWKVNHGDRFLSRLFSILAKLPLLEEYFSHDMYVILEKDNTFLRF